MGVFIFMSVSYVKFMKHAVKVTKSVSEARPVLQGVCHYEDGSLAVTDSHRLYFAKNVQETSKQVVKNPKTGEVINGNYPEIKRLLPSDGSEQFEVILNVPETLTALKMMLLVDKQILVRFVVENHDLMMKVDTRQTLVTFNAGGLDGKKEKTDYSDVNAFINGKYLADAFDFFKDLDIPVVIMKYYGNDRMVTFSTNHILALVLPVRQKAVVK